MKAWAASFYNSAAWAACRDAFLKSKGYLCERCAAHNELVPAKIAHHKKYLTKENIFNPAIALSWDNLEALCQDCHNKEHHKPQSQRKRYRFDSKGDLYPPYSEIVKGRTDTEGG